MLLWNTLHIVFQQYSIFTLTLNMLSTLFSIGAHLKALAAAVNYIEHNDHVKSGSIDIFILINRLSIIKTTTVRVETICGCIKMGKSSFYSFRNWANMGHLWKINILSRFSYSTKLESSKEQHPVCPNKIIGALIDPIILKCWSSK